MDGDVCCGCCGHALKRRATLVDRFFSCLLVPLRIVNRLKEGEQEWRRGRGGGGT